MTMLNAQTEINEQHSDIDAVDVLVLNGYW